MPNALVVAAVVFIILIGLILIVELFAVLALLLTTRRMLEELHVQLHPLATQTQQLLKTAAEMAQTFQENTEHIATRTVQASDSVNDGIDRISRLAQKVVATPIFYGLGAFAGLRQGVAAWRTRRATPETPAPPPNP
jgi:uncharacterized protein YoxC